MKIWLDTFIYSKQQLWPPNVYSVPQQKTEKEKVKGKYIKLQIK